MGAHLVEGEFQSDKYPTCPRGKVPLSCGDPTAQDLLWEYAQRRRSVDAEFASDLEEALRIAGYEPRKSTARTRWGVWSLNENKWWPRAFDHYDEAQNHLERCSGPGTRAEVRERPTTFIRK